MLINNDNIRSATKRGNIVENLKMKIIMMMELIFAITPPLLMKGMHLYMTNS